MFGGPQVGVDLSSMDPRLLLLHVGLLLVREELHTWLWSRSLHHDRWDGLECQSAIWRWCGGDGDNQSYHIAPLGARGFRAPPAPLVAVLSSEES
jgi:hypothetical protein